GRQPGPAVLALRIGFGHENEADLPAVPRAAERRGANCPATVLIEIKRKHDSAIGFLQEHLYGGNMAEILFVKKRLGKGPIEQIDRLAKTVLVSQSVPVTA